MRSYILVLVCFFTLIACSNEIEEWEMEVQNKPISIAYIGEKPNIEIEGVTFKSYSENIDYEGLWISHSELDNFTSKEALDDIRALLKEGKAVVFLTEENAFDTIAPALGIKGNEESEGGNVIQHGFYLWDEDGGTRIGFVYGDKDTELSEIFLKQTIIKSRDLDK